MTLFCFLGAAPVHFAVTRQHVGAPLSFKADFGMQGETLRAEITFEPFRTPIFCDGHDLPGHNGGPPDDEDQDDMSQGDSEVDANGQDPAGDPPDEDDGMATDHSQDGGDNHNGGGGGGGGQHNTEPADPQPDDPPARAEEAEDLGAQMDELHVDEPRDMPVLIGDIEEFPPLRVPCPLVLAASGPPRTPSALPRTPSRAPVTSEKVKKAKRVPLRNTKSAIEDFLADSDQDYE